MQEPTPRLSNSKARLISVLVVAFGLFHAANLLFAMLPRASPINRALAPYRQLTGTEQEWGMFYTIPTMQQNEITVEITDVSGAVTEHGPILPGLKDYATHSQIRYYYLLNQLTSPKGDYSEGYIDQLRKEIGSASTGDPTEFTVKFEGDYIRSLDLIDEDGKMTLLQSKSLGPFSVKK